MLSFAAKGGNPELPPGREFKPGLPGSARSKSATGRQADGAQGHPDDARRPSEDVASATRIVSWFSTRSRRRNTSGITSGISAALRTRDRRKRRSRWPVLDGELLDQRVLFFQRQLGSSKGERCLL